MKKGKSGVQVFDEVDLKNLDSDGRTFPLHDSVVVLHRSCNASAKINEAKVSETRRDEERRAEEAFT